MQTLNIDLLMRNNRVALAARFVYNDEQCIMISLRCVPSLPDSCEGRGITTAWVLYKCTKIVKYKRGIYAMIIHYKPKQNRSLIGELSAGASSIVIYSKWPWEKALYVPSPTTHSLSLSLSLHLTLSLTISNHPVGIYIYIGWRDGIIWTMTSSF